MSIRFDGSSDYYAVTETPVNAAPMTVSAWVKPASSHQGTVFSITDASTDNEYFWLFLNTDNKVWWLARQAGPQGFATTVNTYGLGRWIHVCGREVSASSRFVYLDGDVVNRGSNSTSITPSVANLDTTSIAALNRTTTKQTFDGCICHVAMWDVALSEGEIGALSRRMSPRTIRPGSLNFYAPMDMHRPFVRSAALRNNATVLTAVGSPIQGERAPSLIGLEPRRIYFVPPAAALGRSYGWISI